MENNSGKYHRKGFGLQEQVRGELKQEYDSSLITELRQNGNTLRAGSVTIKLAEAFGFCWGVDRAVSMAYETRRHFPNSRIWITNEIIHNPVVNNNLRQMDILFVSLREDGSKDFSGIEENDVVILPAFGASLQEMQLLSEKSCVVVDTTCPWVSRVWGRVNKYKDAEFTAIIHGKYNHEETIATSSRAEKYLIVQNLSEANWVASYILNGGDGKDFLNKFSRAYSVGFDPDRDLERLGVANQTTMLKGETEQIGKLFEKTMLAKYGPDKIGEHFLSPGDTICDATQERQDAMLKLVEEPLDLMVVIGGYNSSNTGHLQEIAVERNLRSYHIDGPNAIGPGNCVAHKLAERNATEVISPWLPEGEIRIGITAGASTPDQVISGVISRILEIKEAEAKTFA